MGDIEQEEEQKMTSISCDVAGYRGFKSRKRAYEAKENRTTDAKNSEFLQVLFEAFDKQFPDLGVEKRAEILSAKRSNR